jgi:hypothetical protein
VISRTAFYAEGSTIVHPPRGVGYDQRIAMNWTTEYREVQGSVDLDISTQL